MQRNSCRFVVAFARCVAVAATLTLGGCHQAIRDQAQVDPVVRATRGNAWFSQPVPILPNCSIEKWIERASVAGSGDIVCPASQPKQPDITLVRYDAANPIERRTQAQAELMTYADQVCDSHIAGIYSSHALLNFDLGLLAMLFSGGSAIATGRTATNLAAESALFSGARSLVNSEVYYGYIGPAVMREIRAMRGDLRAQITEKRSCGINDYPPQEAINDALIYHDACSFSTGLASLLSKAGSTRVGEDKLRVAQLKAMAARLVAKKAELKAAEDGFAALSADEAKGPKGEVLRNRIATLTAEIARIDGILAFTGVVDPEPATTVAADPQESVDEAEADVERKRSRQNAAVAGDTAAAQAELAAAMQRRDTAVHRRDTEIALNAEIAQKRKSLVELSALQRNLEVEKAKLPEGAPGAAARRSKDAKIARIKDEIKTTTSAVAEAEQQRKSVEVPATQQGGIEFGIQRCAPLTPPTVRQ